MLPGGDVNTLEDLIQEAVNWLKSKCVDENGRMLMRKDNVTPIWVHPYKAMKFLYDELCVRDAATLLGALFHDMLEDCGVSKREILNRCKHWEVFGQDVVDAVGEQSDTYISEESGLNKDEQWWRRHEIKLSRIEYWSTRDCLVCLSDLFSNLFTNHQTPDPLASGRYRYWALTMMFPALEERLTKLKWEGPSIWSLISDEVKEILSTPGYRVPPLRLVGSAG